MSKSFIKDFHFLFLPYFSFKWKCCLVSLHLFFYLFLVYSFFFGGDGGVKTYDCKGDCKVCAGN